MQKNRIAPWMSRLELKQWMRQANTCNEYERRLAIRLAELDYPLNEVSTILAVSTPTLRRWIHNYNRQGPNGLEMRNWGGRRRELLTPTQEMEVLSQWPGDQPLSAKRLQQTLNKILGRQVSLKYAYDLIRRHELEARIDHLGGEKMPQDQVKTS